MVRRMLLESLGVVEHFDRQNSELTIVKQQWFVDLAMYDRKGRRRPHGSSHRAADQSQEGGNPAHIRGGSLNAARPMCRRRRPR
ncbi:hypothetical protein MUK42_04689 [Musa troglodytarum]|uniref:Uncharacterized protein n=1 Tax=Musa troglodytarum TaxID=320322 RepID=A0A9E7FTD6_9LILI|nr:hypothetical protein MUK42_04689 [Musa troglodytarum]